MVEMAVCMANGGGGTVVFGVRDRVVGHAAALLGVPAEIDTNLLLKAVYDRTDPRLTPVFEELMVPEGTGRLLLMQVHGGLPPYTDSQGRAKVRVGKDCQPMTGSLRSRVLVETGETDFTAGHVEGRPADLLSARRHGALARCGAPGKRPGGLRQKPGGAPDAGAAGGDPGDPARRRRALGLLPSRSRTEMSGAHCPRIFLERKRAKLRASICEKSATQTQAIRSATPRSVQAYTW
jgi:hypothetical protein